MCSICKAGPGAPFDHQAFLEHYNWLLETARKVERRFSLPPDKSYEDLAHETYDQLVSKDGEPIRETVLGFAWTVMRNTCVGWLRKKSTVSLESLQEAEHLSQEALEAGRLPPLRTPQRILEAPFEEKVLDRHLANQIRDFIATKVLEEVSYPKDIRGLDQTIPTLASRALAMVISKPEAAAAFHVMVSDVVGDDPIGEVFLATFMEFVWGRKDETTRETYKRTVRRGLTELRKRFS